MTRFLPYNPDQTYLLPPNVKDVLGENHLAFVLHRVVQRLDLREFEQVHSEEGGVLYAPQLMLKVWLYAYMLGVTSARRLEQRIQEDLAFRYLAGGARPDNWALSAFRRRHVRGLNDVFTQVLEVARNLGMVSVGHVAIDSTRVRGWASRECMGTETKLRRERARLGRQIRRWQQTFNVEDSDENDGMRIPVRGEFYFARRMAKLVIAETPYILSWPKGKSRIDLHESGIGWSAMRTFSFQLLKLLLIILMLLGPAAISLRAQTVVRSDAGLDKIVPAGAMVEKVYGDFRFVEGPVWDRRGGYLLFSDIPANAIMKWTPDGNVSAFRKQIFSGPYPDGVLIGSNGLTLDRQGRIVAAEHGNRRVARYEKDGAATVLADRYEGKRLNSPNDLVVKKNGDVYFTDPTGLSRNYPADAKDIPKPELDFNGVYRISADGKLTLLTKDMPYPNGLAFSPDEKKLYVANSRPDKFWMVYDVIADGALANGRKLFDATQIPGEDVPDGMKIDTAGNIYATGPAGIMIFSPQGKLLGTVQFPELPANCAWGDADGKTLYVTARTSLYRIHLKIAGIRP